jgi:hypothetical protein
LGPGAGDGRGGALVSLVRQLYSLYVEWMSRVNGRGEKWACSWQSNEPGVR